MVHEAEKDRLTAVFGDKLLVLGAHPDDCELMAGGLLVHWTGERKAVVVTTMQLSHPEKQAVRHREIAAAMKILGVKDWEIATHPDAQLVHDAGLTKYFEVLFREFKPTLIVTHKPDDFHQDHRAISQAVEAALRRSTVTLLHGESYLWPLPLPNLYLDISQEMPLKQRALECYDSIISNETFDPEAVDTFNRMRGSQTFRFRYAEAFSLVKAFF